MELPIWAVYRKSSHSIGRMIMGNYRGTEAELKNWILKMQANQALHRIRTLGSGEEYSWEYEEIIVKSIPEEKGYFEL